MSGLHTRGYRPPRFSRVNLANGGTDTRRWWVLSWRYRREHSGDHLIMDAFDTLSSACIKAREEPDPLDGRRVHMFYGGTRAEAVAAYPLERS